MLSFFLQVLRSALEYDTGRCGGDSDLGGNRRGNIRRSLQSSFFLNIAFFSQIRSNNPKSPFDAVLNVLKGTKIEFCGVLI